MKSESLIPMQRACSYLKNNVLGQLPLPGRGEMKLLATGGGVHALAARRASSTAKDDSLSSSDAGTGEAATPAPVPA
jgi:hypothetical protein